MKKQINYAVRIVFFTLIVVLIGCVKNPINISGDRVSPNNPIILNGHLYFNSREDIENLKRTIIEEGLEKYVSIYKDKGYRSLYQYKDSIVPDKELEYFNYPKNEYIEKPLLYSDVSSPDEYLNFILNTNMEVQIGDTLFQIIRDTIFVYNEEKTKELMNNIAMENKTTSTEYFNQGTQKARISSLIKYGSQTNQNKRDFDGGVFYANQFLINMFFYASAGVESWFEKKRDRCTLFGWICWQSWQRTPIERIKINIKGELVSDYGRQQIGNIRDFIKEDTKTSFLCHYFYRAWQSPTITIGGQGTPNTVMTTLSKILSIPAQYIQMFSNWREVSNVQIQNLRSIHRVETANGNFKEIELVWPW